MIYHGFFDFSRVKACAELKCCQHPTNKWLQVLNCNQCVVVSCCFKSVTSHLYHTFGGFLGVPPDHRKLDHILVGVLEHFIFFHILGTIIPFD